MIPTHDDNNDRYNCLKICRFDVFSHRSIDRGGHNLTTDCVNATCAKTKILNI